MCYDLICSRDVKKCSSELFKGTRATFEMANGNVSSNDYTCMSILEFSQEVVLNVLISTPPVLSLGRRCMEEGFSFVWPANELPYMARPDGHIVQLEVIGNVPYMSPDSLHCRPSPTTETAEFPFPERYAFPRRPRTDSVDAPEKGNSESAVRGATPRAADAKSESAVRGATLEPKWLLKCQSRVMRDD